MKFICLTGRHDLIHISAEAITSFRPINDLEGLSKTLIRYGREAIFVTETVEQILTLLQELTNG